RPWLHLPDGRDRSCGLHPRAHRSPVGSDEPAAVLQAPPLAANGTGPRFCETRGGHPRSKMVIGAPLAAGRCKFLRVFGQNEASGCFRRGFLVVECSFFSGELLWATTPPAMRTTLNS